MKKVSMFLVILCLLNCTAFADFNWNAESGNWSDGVNWDKGYPPDGSENINLQFSGTSVCTLNTAEGPFTNRLIIKNGQTLNIENGGSAGFAWSRVGRNNAAYVNISGNGSFLMNNDDLYIGLEDGSGIWTMSDTSSLIVNNDTDDGDELFIAEDGGSGTLRLIGSGVTVNVDRIHLGVNTGGTLTPQATLEFILDAAGVSTIVTQRSYIAEVGNAFLNISAAAALAAEDIVLIEATSGYDIGGNGVFDMLNGGSAAEGTLLSLGGNTYALTYAYDANGDLEYNDIALVYVPEPATMLLLGLGGVISLRRRR